MLFAMKGNRQTRIEEVEKQKFINLGYKIAKLEKNKLVFEEVETEESKELAILEKENKALKAENEALVAELEVLKEPKQGMSKEESEEKAAKATKTKGEGK